MLQDNKVPVEARTNLLAILLGHGALNIASALLLVNGTDQSTFRRIETGPAIPSSIDLP